MTSKERKALYGATQRLLERVPPLQSDVDYQNDDGWLPMTMSPSMTFSFGASGCDCEDYKEYEVELGNKLLAELLVGGWFESE